MKKLNNFISPAKFLKKQEKNYNKQLLNLEEAYPDLEKIKKDLLKNKYSLNEQNTLIRKILKAYEDFNKDKMQLKKDCLFYNGAYLFNFFLIFLIFNVFWKLAIPLGFYLIGYLICNTIEINRFHPYLKTYLYAKIHGLGQDELITYQKLYETLFLERYCQGDRDNELSLNALEIVTQKESQLAKENQELDANLLIVRNAAIWQIQAFKDNQEYLQKALNQKNYYDLMKDIMNIRKLLQDLSLAQGQEKEKLALLIDETLDEIYNLYDNCEKESSLVRKKG